MAKAPQPIRALFAPVRALFVGDASAGILLILVAAAAMLLANSTLAHEYHELFHGTLPFTPVPKLDTLHLWVNDGLMAIFFFVVGLEVKREWIEGQLSSADQRRLPVLAAVAGMVIPAAVYLFFVQGEAPQLAQGWAIPAATDIAFAMGVLGLLGNRVPGSLRLFLLTVAIVDDIGAVLIIAIAYTAGIKLGWLIGAIVAALMIPMVGKDDNTMLEKLEHGLAPWSAYLIVPVFGFANAGVDLSDLGLAGIFAPLPLAIAAGLFLGKQVGIVAAIFAADKVGFAPRPHGASWAEIWGVSILCGIGFTMSLFIGELAFPGYRLLIDEAKIGILLGSACSAILGYTILRMTTRHPGDTRGLANEG